MHSVIPFLALFLSVPTGLAQTVPINRSNDVVQPDFLLGIPNVESLKEWSHYYTSSGPHFVGQGRVQAEWTNARWKEFGIQNTSVLEHTANITYPDRHRVALVDYNRDPSVLHEAQLMEDGVPARGENQEKFLSAIFPGAGSGNITGQYIFANFGLSEDFEDLVRANVSLQGKIAVVKSVYKSKLLADLGLGTHRSRVFKAADDYGLAGLIIYTDPQNDGDITEANGYQPYPDGPARPSSSIERGQISFGKPSSVLAMPISYRDAIPILRALNGHGPRAATLGERWRGGGLAYKGIHYNVGPSPSSLGLNLVNFPTTQERSVYNVIGTIPGESFPDEVIVLGNHRDAWGPGAGDAGSGASALNEVVRSLGAALALGWKPHRTIVFASFDGEEHYCIGSRRWISDNLAWLNATTVAYLGVVLANAGSEFHLRGSPLLTRAMQLSTARVPAPSASELGATMLDKWGGNMSSGSGGDASMFMANMISVADLGFMPTVNESPLPYHTQFDNDDWMDRFGDPDRVRQLTMTKIWLLAAFYLINDPIMPVHVHDYAAYLRRAFDSIQQQTPQSLLDLSPLDRAIVDMDQASFRFDEYAGSLAQEIEKQPNNDFLRVDASDVNRRYIQLERLFASPRRNNSVDPHLVLSGSSYYFEGQSFPGLNKLIETDNWAAAKTTRDDIVSAIYDIISLLGQ